MSRRSPLDAILWRGLIEKGKIRCKGCDEFIKLKNCENINDAIDTWNDHVNSCSGNARFSPVEEVK